MKIKIELFCSGISWVVDDHVSFFLIGSLHWQLPYSEQSSTGNLVSIKNSLHQKNTAIGDAKKRNSMLQHRCEVLLLVTFSWTKFGTALKSPASAVAFLSRSLKVLLILTLFVQHWKFSANNQGKSISWSLFKVVWVICVDWIIFTFGYILS